MKRILFLALILAGCGDSATEPEVLTYESIAGIYYGTMIGDEIAVDYILTISQTADGKITGESASITTFADGSVVAGEGSFTGSIAAGLNPAVTLDGGEACGVSNTWRGLYDSVGGVLTLSGTLIYVDPACTVILQFPATLILKP